MQPVYCKLLSPATSNPGPTVSLREFWCASNLFQMKGQKSIFPLSPMASVTVPGESFAAVFLSGYVQAPGMSIAVHHSLGSMGSFLSRDEKKQS